MTLRHRSREEEFLVSIAGQLFECSRTHAATHNLTSKLKGIGFGPRTNLIVFRRTYGQVTRHSEADLEDGDTILQLNSVWSNVEDE